MLFVRTDVRRRCVLLALAAWVCPARAEAQPLPELPSSPMSPGTAPAERAAVQAAPAPPSTLPDYVPPRPAPFVYIPPPEATHAPMYALFVGARIGLNALAGGFFQNEFSQVETTGKFVGTGLAPQVDLGVRISKRYVPYLFYEHGFYASGSRFAGTSATASSEFRGIGVRTMFGNIDRVSFLWDLSFGWRTIGIRNAGSSYSMDGLELFRVGIGAEVRASTAMTVSPLVALSTGQMSNAEGDIAYAVAGDSLSDAQRPTFRGGVHIPAEKTQNYAVIWLGCGVHWDLFGN